MSGFEKIVVVTRKTPLQGLVERFNTLGQARFYIEHGGGDFEGYVVEDAAWRASLDHVVGSLDLGLRLQIVDRALVPTMIFTDRDLVVTVGGNGLVANTAKYVGRQPIVAINPDPSRQDGILTPFQAPQTRAVVERVLANRAETREVTLAEAVTHDGQRLLAFNDLFVGARSHVSAVYEIGWGDVHERQSSSGLVVSTGAGSTGWLSSMFNMARGLLRFRGESAPLEPIRLPWADPRLVFVVREPFVSPTSEARIVAGMVEGERRLHIESRMASGGVIFSDGIEEDYVSFTSGVGATIGPAAERAVLVAA
jgi:hypothetical protein